MTGLITLKKSGKKYIFRTDNDNDKFVYAWDIYSDPSRGMTNKWPKMPDGDIELFDIDNIPLTVSFQPILK